MKRAAFHMPSPAMVVSLIALFVALGGSGYAAVTLQKNSVGSAQIKRGAVKSSDIAKNAVTSTKVKDGSLLSADFKSGQLLAGPAGAQGPKGDTGAQGVPGPVTASAFQTSKPDPGVVYYDHAVQPITTPTSGKLWIEGVAIYTTTLCVAGGGEYNVALYLDGTFVPGTRRVLTLAESADGQSGSIQTFGIADSVPAGLHYVALRGLMTGGCSGSYGSDSIVGAIAIG